MNNAKQTIYRRGPRSLNENRKHYLSNFLCDVCFFDFIESENSSIQENGAPILYGRAQSLRNSAPITTDVNNGGIVLADQNQIVTKDLPYSTTNSDISDWDWTIKRILQRPTIIKKGKFDKILEGNINFEVIDLPIEYFKMNATTNIKNSFQLVRGSLWVEVSIQGSPFAQGLIALSAQFGNRDLEKGVISTYNGANSAMLRDHVIGDVSDVTCNMRLKIPFRHYGNYTWLGENTWCSCVLTTISDISASGVQYTISMWWDSDVDVKIITAGKAQGNSFVITKINKFGNVANSTLPVNVEGDSLDGNASNEFKPDLKLSGLDLPTNTLSPIEISAKNISCMSNSENIVQIDKLNLHPKEIQECDANTFGTYEDECDYNVLLGREQMVSKYVYDTTSSKIQTIVSVGPNGYVASGVTNLYPIANLIATQYAFWRMDYTYNFYIASSRFHSGKIFIGFAASQEVPKTMEEAIGGYGAYVDIGGASNRFSITIPFISKYNKLMVYKGSMANINVLIHPTMAPISEMEFFLGYLYIVPITPLVQCSPDVATKVDIIITCQNSNVEFYRHTPASLVPVVEAYEKQSAFTRKLSDKTTVEYLDHDIKKKKELDFSVKKDSTYEGYEEDLKKLAEAEANISKGRIEPLNQTPEEKQMKIQDARLKLLLGKAQALQLLPKGEKKEEYDIPSTNIRDLFKTYVSVGRHSFNLTSVFPKVPNTGYIAPKIYFVFPADYFLCAYGIFHSSEGDVVFDYSKGDYTDGFAQIYAGYRGSVRYKLLVSASSLMVRFNKDKVVQTTYGVNNSTVTAKAYYVSSYPFAKNQVPNIPTYYKYCCLQIAEDLAKSQQSMDIISGFVPITVNYVSGNTTALQFEVPYSKHTKYSETIIKDGVQLDNNFIVLEMSLDVNNGSFTEIKPTADSMPGAVTSISVETYKAFGDETRLGIIDAYNTGSRPEFGWLAFQSA